MQITVVQAAPTMVRILSLSLFRITSIPAKCITPFDDYIVIDNLDGNDASLRSANAALCANEQGRFWDYHDTLFANQVTEDAYLFTDARLTTMAQNLKLDMTAFDQCFKARKYAGDIQKDIDQARALGVTGTPSVFVDGTLISKYNQVPQAIDDALAGK